MIEAVVSNIQRLSTEDGPGIRTTVFLKGCTLRCAWCHNPESLERRGVLGYIGEKCKACGSCIPACPTGSLSLEGGRLHIDDSRCSRCFLCVGECHNHALVGVGRFVSVEALYDMVAEDEEYFRLSGGGVTFSGGEPLLQKDFLISAIRRLHEKAIDVIVETSLCASLDEELVEVLKLCSVIYVDLKMWDETAHERWTGQSNRRILDNLRRLDEEGVRILVRTPVVEGVNDTGKEISSIAGFVRTLKNVEGYKLIPYHPYGLAKYEEFRWPVKYGNRNGFPPGRLEELERLASEIMEKNE